MSLPYEKEYNRRQRRLRGSFFARPKVIIVGLVVAASLIILSGCNPMIVTGRFPDGSPREITEILPSHADYDEISASDRFCALVGACINWDSPKVRYWHQHWYHDYIGPQGQGYWIHTEGEWHNYLTCELLIEQTDYGCIDPVVTAIRG